MRRIVFVWLIALASCSPSEPKTVTVEVPRNAATEKRISQLEQEIKDLRLRIRKLEFLPMAVEDHTSAIETTIFNVHEGASYGYGTTGEFSKRYRKQLEKAGLVPTSRGRSTPP